MQSTDIPAKFPQPFAINGTKRTIPAASQIGILAGAASLNDGFPPVTFLPIGAGGTPPAGADMNGILNLITQWIQWENAGGQVGFDAAQCTAIGGYPKGAMLLAASGLGLWVNGTEANTSNPDTGGAGWSFDPFRGPTVPLAGSATAAAANHLATFIGTGTLNLPLAATAGNGFAVGVYASGGPITLSPNVLNGFNGGTAGATFQIAANGSAVFLSDGNLNWWVLNLAVPFTSAVRYVNSAGAITLGEYLVDTSAGPFPLTLTPTPTRGDSYTFTDATNSWMSNPVTLARNGNTIMGLASDLICNIPDQRFTLWFNGTTWRLL